MSIPLSRLYSHLHNKSDLDMFMYGWIPYGSKKLSELVPLNSSTDWVGRLTTPLIIMHDQEPLYFDLWSKDDFAQQWRDDHNLQSADYCYLDPERIDFQTSMHLRGLLNFPSINLYDYVMIAHSEQNSSQIEKYKQHGFIPVYFWSHALIALDWFRYAAHDPVLQYKVDQFDQDFLIYNRAWSGTREYRLKFTELIVNANLVKNSLVKFSAHDQDKNYIDHDFVNPKLTIQNKLLHTLIDANTHSSESSADFNNNDYARSGIEVVLETLFDDSRWHLTEKTLRPIACGKPFILAGTAGSLQYLRNYGFETFHGLIDENYDTITDPVDRLQAIVNEMTRISALSCDTKRVLFQRLHEVAARNKCRFFSHEWQYFIEEEFYNNVNNAMIEMNSHCTGKYWKKSITMPNSAGSLRRPPEQLDQLQQWLQLRSAS